MGVIAQFNREASLVFGTFPLSDLERHRSLLSTHVGAHKPLSCAHKPLSWC